MVIAFLLAQLVLPSAPSGPIQPPGMICASGDCSGGPMVWRTSSDRGKLVVACDMTSDTCSDGRKITTVRASPVPCEVEPGVWQTIPEDVGCYSVRGLESWSANTSYLSWGAELDRSPWSSRRGGTVEAIPDGYRITSAAGESASSGIIQGVATVSEAGPATLACRVRTQGQIDRLTLEAGTGVGRNFAAFDTGGEWATIAVSGEVAAGAARWAVIAPRNDDLSPESVDVRACWHTRSSTPGRACWGGEAPVTCDGDRHTVSTEGWPTEEGEISIRFDVPDTPGTHYVWDSRAGASGTSRVFWNGGTLSLRLPRVIDIPWAPGAALLSVRRAGDTITVMRDKAVVATSPGSPPMEHGPTAVLGSHASASGQEFNGSISSLRVRSFE